MSDSTNTTVDWNTYDLGAASKPQKAFPPKGQYLLRIPTLKPGLTNDAPDSIFKTGNEQQLKAELGPLHIIGGPTDGFELRFCTISNKRYSNRNASQMGDFLLAAHSPFRPQDEAQWKQAVLATSGGVVEAGCDWDAYDKVSKKSLCEGMENFPKNADGSYQRWIDVADATAPNGKRRVWANLRVVYFRIPRKDQPAAPLVGSVGSTPGGTTADLL